MTTQNINELQLFDITHASIAELNEKYKDLKINGIDDTEGYKIVRAARLDIKGYRVKVEKRRKELLEDALAYQRKINSAAKTIEGMLDPIEQNLHTQEKAYEAEKERVKKELERAEAEKLRKKIDQLLGVGFNFDGIVYRCEFITKRLTLNEVKMLPDYEFDYFINTANATYRQHLAEKQAEASRQAAIKAQEEKERKEEAERIRIEKEKFEKFAREQAEKERQAREQIERERAELWERKQEQEAKEAAFKAELKRVEDEKAKALEKPPTVIMTWDEDDKSKFTGIKPVTSDELHQDKKAKKYYVDICGQFKVRVTVFAVNKEHAEELANIRLHDCKLCPDIDFEQNDMQAYEVN